ncbi:hypothetical protein Tco_1507162 [Tanacetum coccineum]
MVAYLQKSKGSEGLYQIIDFLTTSHIKYVLTENPTIYVSLIHQFWETASASTLENGEMEITATIDGRIKTIIEASIRRNINLEDSNCIPTLPNAKNFKQLALMGDEGSLTLNELMVLCTTLSKKVEHKGKIIAEIDQNPSISLVQDERTSWIQEDAETQRRTSADIEILLDQEEPIKLVEDPVSTAIPERQVYIKRSAEKRKDKGKAIMKDDEFVQRKTKKQLEQERLGHEEAIRLQEQINKEERQMIAKDAEIAKELQEEIDIARQEQEKYYLAQALELQKELDNRKEAEVRKNMCMYLKNQGGYKQSYFKRMSYEDIRPIFERVWDQNQSFVPKDSEIEKEVMRRSGFDFQKPPAKRQKIREVSGLVEEQSAGK